MAAHREDARRVVRAIVSVVEHALVAGALAFLEHLPAYPPHCGMKPEQRLDEPVNVRLEIVAPLDVFELVCEHGVHLRLGQSPEQRGRQQHHRTKNARHGRLYVGIRDACIRRCARRRPRCPG